MHPLLEEARDIILGLVARDSLPEHLVGDIQLDDVEDLVKSMVEAEIRARLENTPSDLSDEESWETIQDTMHAVAKAVGLVCMQAMLTLFESGVELGQTEPAADLAIPVNAEYMSQLLVLLMRKKAVTVTVTLDE